LVLGREDPLGDVPAAPRLGARVPGGPPVDREVDEERERRHPRRVERGDHAERGVVGEARVERIEEPRHPAHGAEREDGEREATRPEAAQERRGSARVTDLGELRVGHHPRAAPEARVEHDGEHAAHHHAPPEPVPRDPVLDREPRHGEWRVGRERGRDHRGPREPPGDRAAREEVLVGGGAGAPRVEQRDRDGEDEVEHDDRPVDRGEGHGVPPASGGSGVLSCCGNSGAASSRGSCSTRSRIWISSPIAAPRSLNLRAAGSTRSSMDPTARLYTATALVSASPIASKWPPSVRMRSYSCFPSSLICSAFLAICSWRHPKAIARRSAISVVGVATTTRLAIPSSMRLGSASTAADTNASPGMNITTSSAAFPNSSQYALPASALMCCLTWPA